MASDRDEELAAARQSLAVALQVQQETMARLAAAERAAADAERLGADLAEIRASEAYRVGRVVTWPARHAKRLLGRR